MKYVAVNTRYINRSSQAHQRPKSMLQPLRGDPGIVLGGTNATNKASTSAGQGEGQSLLNSCKREGIPGVRLFLLHSTLNHTQRQSSVKPPSVEIISNKR